MLDDIYLRRIFDEITFRIFRGKMLRIIFPIGDDVKEDYLRLGIYRGQRDDGKYEFVFWIPEKSKTGDYMVQVLSKCENGYYLDPMSSQHAVIKKGSEEHGLWEKLFKMEFKMNKRSAKRISSC